ncbi:MAG TPA: class I SAM-dependent methyltransferase [Bacteroidia bacterium]|jgi:2-polyprenyl-3-methyl-5-hydroxy-6-metoxy-1,4-benzoquinol methylase
MPCPYCNHSGSSKSYLPSTGFNDKIFRYVKCDNCEVVYITPLPEQSDYYKMYPPDYQQGVDRTILPDPYKKLSGLRFSYGVQFDLIKKHFKGSPRMLDYGCGNANFLLNASAHGFTCDGVEFNQEHVDILKKEIPTSKFYTINEFLNSPQVTYDIIRLSNVLEHLDTPVETIRAIVGKLNPGGLLLIEGPIEMNTNLAMLSRKLYFKLKNISKGGYIADHTPTHITFTNSTNQLRFFSQFELLPLEFKTQESPWPYPNSFSSASGVGGKVKALIAKISIFVSSSFTGWGNTFIYVGRKK